MKEILDQLIALIKRFEGCRLVAYQDIVGVWTIGWGETLGVRPGMVWTQEQADNVLQSRVFQFMIDTLTKCPQLYLEPGYRTVACSSLTYNIGVAAFGASSVCRHTKRKTYNQAADSFLLWNKAGGRVVKGLTWRRGKERLVYLNQ